MSRPSPAEIKVEVLNEAEAKLKSEPKTRPKPNKSKPTIKRTVSKAKTTRMKKNRIKWRLSDFLESSPRLSAAEKRLARRRLIYVIIAATVVKQVFSTPPS